jgi:23S rRNA G2445 N2-methylase RlmL
LEDRFRFFVTCARGTEGALRRELVGLRIGSPKGDTGGVWFEGPLRMGMGVCLHARVAVRVLLQVSTFEAATADALYQGARAVDWSAWLSSKSTLAVHATIRAGAPAEPREEIGSRRPPGRAPERAPAPAFGPLAHSGYAALKVKDAVVDVLRDKLGARPDVDTQDPDVALVLHLADGHAGLFLDLAGEPLHRRGYRVAMTDAPLKETLAAAVLVLGGARDPAAIELPFVDPMGGSGTLAIEQALAARGVPPGLGRRFGFTRWPGFAGEREAAWRALLDEARAQAAAAHARPLPAPIVYADVDPQALAAARQNAAAAGVAADIQFQRADISELAPRWPQGTVVTNPPYGERLNARDLGATYRRMAIAFRRLAGWGVVVLSGNPQLAREMTIKPRISHRLFNGPLEVRLLRYEIGARDRI